MLMTSFTMLTSNSRSLRSVSVHPQAIKKRKLVTGDGEGGTVVIDLATGTNDGPSDELKKEALREMETLRIPRRPAWDGKRKTKDQILLENVVRF